jgi:hypothetical protein
MHALGIAGKCVQWVVASLSSILISEAGGFIICGA